MSAEKIIDSLKEHIIALTPEEIEEEKKWIAEQIDEIGPEVLGALIGRTVEVRTRAYKPYSDYSVGAGVLTRSGKMHFSINAESVSFTETDHAERSAITKAISEGAIEEDGEQFVKAIVVSHEGESGPCGGCRQRIGEHAENCLIVDVDEEGNVQGVSSLKLLFPYAFTPHHLGN